MTYTDFTAALQPQGMLACLGFPLRAVTFKLLAFKALRVEYSLTLVWALLTSVTFFFFFLPHSHCMPVL